jgi:hypothetical protein
LSFFLLHFLSFPSLFLKITIPIPNRSSYSQHHLRPSGARYNAKSTSSPWSRSSSFTLRTPFGTSSTLQAMAIVLSVSSFRDWNRSSISSVQVIVPVGLN